MLSESNDQSGMVGFLVGIIVLVFAGIGFSLIIDKRFRFSSGQADLEQTLAEEKNQLASLKRRVGTTRDEFKAKSQPVTGQPAELEKAERAASSSALRLKELRDEQVVLKDTVEAAKVSFAEYRAAFRKQARQAAVGEKLAQLEAIGGKIYRDVTVRRVTAAGVEIVHAQGVSSLGPQDLPESWQERFQWDAEESKGAAEGEKTLADPSGKLAATRSQMMRPGPVAAPEKLPKSEADKKLAALRRDVAEAKRRLDRSELEVTRVRAEAQKNPGKSVPGSLDTWEDRISQLESASESFRAQYQAALGRLSVVSPGDALLRDSSSR